MFRLRAFGGLTLEQDGAPYVGPATQRRRLALLAVVAAADAGVSRDRLADYLWPDADPARGRHSLDGALSALRRELRSDDLFVGVATLRLNPEVMASDLADYAAALASGDHERAAALYAGPFLDGFYVPGAGEFERWVEGERRRRADAHARLLEGLAAAAEQRGDRAAAVRWRQARVDLDPLHTPATLRLLGALSASGNPAEALRVARVHESLVREELDGAPGPGWTAAVDGLRAELARPPAATPAHMPPAAPPALTPASGTGSAASRGASAEQVVAPAADGDDQGASVVTSPTAPAHGESPAIPAAGAHAAEDPRTVRAIARPRRRRAALVAAAGALLLAALASGSEWRSRRAARPLAAAGVRAENPAAASVAILPFANTSGDPDDEPFADGLTDELIAALDKVQGLKVTGRTSAFALKGRRLGVRAVADTLGVATVLEGGVRRAGNRLKVTAVLVSASDNAVLWSETYDRELADVFAMQEEIARAIVGALGPRLGGRVPSVGRIPTRDLATYELYLKGRYFWSRRTPDDLRRAADHFEQAVARDPTYAQAYAGLADARVLRVIVAGRPPEEELPRAREAAAAAIRLDPTLAEAHAALGNMLEAFDWDWAAAERELAQATALDPGYATARLYRGIALLHQARFDEAITELAEARALDPLSAPVRLQLGRAYVFARRPGEAIGPLRASLELNPQFAPAHQHLGEAYLQQGKHAEALASFRRAALLRGARDSAHLAYALAATGERAEAERVLRELLGSSGRRYLPPVPMATAYAGLGDREAAFRWLERGYAERAALMNTLKVAPAFDPLRDDPRWARLLGRMGLEPQARPTS